jgi:hypothetical protein
MTIDFTELTEQPELWPKTNDFGQPATVRKPALTPGTPMRKIVVPSHYPLEHEN